MGASLFGAPLAVGSCVKVTCSAAGPRFGAEATVATRIFPGPIAHLDVYRITFADGGDMAITANNLQRVEALEAGEANTDQEGSSGFAAGSVEGEGLQTTK
eukprot:gnl/TRDRNA2_/TRDRNA2_193357_c0_seq1.p1 gnl/TRDRNA2_/TRDRNA2_193357_c0~~gnl/TRDRNA2_/TRDRNA2_193357_c0_seq1.p1  ORF type:complete len:108 (-),score=13.52 gnl/TRDRNA2_/TRDRNA2_193357_c0_seq1:49-351(-)